MAEYQEEIYLIEKREITDDEDDDSEFEKMISDAQGMDLPQLSTTGAEADEVSDDDDLNDFNALKAKTSKRQDKKIAAAAVTGGSNMQHSIGGT